MDRGCGRIKIATSRKEGEEPCGTSLSVISATWKIKAEVGYRVRSGLGNIVRPCLKAKREVWDHGSVAKDLPSTLCSVRMGVGEEGGRETDIPRASHFFPREPS